MSGQPFCGDAKKLHDTMYVICDKGWDHDGPHSWSVTWGQDRPTKVVVPKWRQLVDTAIPTRGYLTTLAGVLAEVLSVAEADAEFGGRGPIIEGCLARIVAVCEREVGDGWHAEPDYNHHPGQGISRCNIECLIYALAWTTAGKSRWRVLGSRAASWLAALTGDVS